MDDRVGPIKRTEPEEPEEIPVPGSGDSSKEEQVAKEGKRRQTRMKEEHTKRVPEPSKAIGADGAKPKTSKASADPQLG